MAYWILKTEPSVYSFADLQRDGATAWDGVTSNPAQLHLRAMQPGDEALIYHTGSVRAAIGLARIQSAPYPDPAAPGTKQVAVTVVPLRPLARPVDLAHIKAEPALAESALVRQGRLSVAPCTPAQWQALLALAGEDPAT